MTVNKEINLDTFLVCLPFVSLLKSWLEYQNFMQGNEFGLQFFLSLSLDYVKKSAIMIVGLPGLSKK